VDSITAASLTTIDKFGRNEELLAGCLVAADELTLKSGSVGNRNAGVFHYNGDRESRRDCIDCGT